jgi:SAM-dependent methyltransferase
MSLPEEIKRLVPARVKHRVWEYVVGARSNEPSMTDNVNYNRFYWDRYVREWDNPDFERDRSSAEGTGDSAIIGEEWGTPGDVDEIVETYIVSQVSPDSVVLEIGSGGGRIASRVAPQVGELWCLDVSQEMLARLRRTLGDHDNVRFVLANTPAVPLELRGRLDFAYSFDVFVHLDLHTQWQYIDALARGLKPGGRAFLHTANLTTDNGWARFAAQPHFTVGGYYFVTPEVVRTMLHRAGLEVVEEADQRPTGYRAQDYLVLVEKPASK